MKHILSILDGMEQGIEITLENDTIYSIGTQDDSDFYVRKNTLDFLVYFRVTGEVIEWWSQKKVAALKNGVDLSLSLNTIELPANEVIEVGGRQFGVFYGKKAVAEVKKSLEPSGQDVVVPEPSLDDDATVLPSTSSIEPESLATQQDEVPLVLPTEQPVPLELDVQDHSADELIAAQELSVDPMSIDLETTHPVTIDPKVIEAAQQDFSAQDRKDSSKDNSKATPTSTQERQSKLFELLKVMPFVVGIIILIAYGVMNTKSSNAPPSPVNMSPEAKDKKDNENTMMNDSTVESVEQMLAAEGVDASIEEQVVDPKASEFIASGAEYNTGDKWKRLQPVSATDEHALESLRKKVDEGTVQPIEAAEVLFPDEKMMSLIKDMLDTAGAEGIDVRFERGSYDVFGYVMDDEKWQRIHKILTFDLDLTKVQFSVETSASLIKKYESLLKKFNLSDFAVLSLGSNGQIFAKTYYPPALEGLWYTIKSRFESKYGQYTNIKEYRAHIGWINVVKVSFDQPAYVLLADGRRLVEGSIWGGSSVLDKIYNDAIRVTSGPTEARYYVINKSRALVGSDLSEL